MQKIEGYQPTKKINTKPPGDNFILWENVPTCQRVTVWEITHAFDGSTDPIWVQGMLNVLKEQRCKAAVCFPCGKYHPCKNEPLYGNFCYVHTKQKKRNFKQKTKSFLLEKIKNW